jgi:hypothetical protein
MKTRTELAEFFAPVTEDQLDSLEVVQAAGKAHGEAGYYPDADFSSDADWCYGVGATIDRLESELECDGGEVFDLYTAAHGAHLQTEPDE